MRACQPCASGLAMWRDLIPVPLGWIIARVVSPGNPGWDNAAMAILEWQDSVQCADASPGH